MDYFGIDPANLEAPPANLEGGARKAGQRTKHHRSEPLSFNASIMKLWRHQHPSSSMGSKAMSAINGVVTDVGKQIASLAAEAAAKARHMTISERDIELAADSVFDSKAFGRGLVGGEEDAAAAPAESIAGGKVEYWDREEEEAEERSKSPKKHRKSPKKHRKSPKHKSPARAPAAGAPKFFSVSRAERLIRMEAKGDQRVSRMACVSLAHKLQTMTSTLLRGAHGRMEEEKRKRKAAMLGASAPQAQSRAEARARAQAPNGEASGSDEDS